MGGADYLVGDTAKHDFFHAFIPVRAHDDQITSNFSSIINNLLSNVA